MPKRTQKNRYMKTGGDIITTYPSSPPAPNSFTTWMNSAKKAMSSAANSVSSAASSATNAVTKAVTPSPTPSPPPSPPPPPMSSFGGKRLRKGGKTAQPQVWVGGKRRNKTCNKNHKHGKSCRVKTYKKGRKTKFSFDKSLKRLLKM